MIVVIRGRLIEAGEGFVYLCLFVLQIYILLTEFNASRMPYFPKKNNKHALHYSNAYVKRFIIHFKNNFNDNLLPTFIKNKITFLFYVNEFTS